MPISELLDERRHLLDVAHWMLGSGSAAEEVIDDAYQQWCALAEEERARIASPRAWLAKAAGSVCLARPALPRRVPPGAVDGAAPGAADGVAPGAADGVAPGAADGAADEGDRQRLLEEEISEVLLDALDSLSPAERAAFVLNDAFGTAPGTVADIVGQPEPECAEPTDRARDSLRARRARSASVRRHDAVARRVGKACVAEDAALLASVTAPDVTASFDGGGKIRALVRPVYGREQVARSLLTLLARRPRTTLRTQSVNGRTGLVVRYDDLVAAVVSLDVAGHLVAQVWITLNPDKLRSWNRPGSPPDTGRHRGSPAGTRRT
ncbi:RNA polymerase subunit sigma [Streptacidiphilus sp. ASG 303]|uniref:RNA polymerase subunit sigma n=1 Tax=Streptacidiphilus sp. ASG 303 TaxID=2896847 RepID=UPI001E4DC877|nr:RNA polymerase subunit sigma [Streptacidiphilus sp. ASG 303]MCD0484874.1 RNA polymerase subunit sigma [Streptacidiphilus sp. ASG 303]